MTRYLQIRLQKTPPSDWRPSLIMITPRTFDRFAPMRMLSWLCHRYGFGTYLHFIQGMLNRENVEEARDVLTQLVARHPKAPSVPIAYLRLGDVYQELKEYQEAISQFSKVLSSRDRALAAEAQYEIGESYASIGDYKESAVQYLKVAYLYPSERTWYFKALLRAGESYERLEKWQDARQVYTKIADEAHEEDVRRFAQEKLAAIESRSP